METNKKKNIEYICKMIKKGEMFPINLYSYKILCNCENTEIRVGGIREELEKEFKECPNCKTHYRISEGLIHMEHATLIFLNKPDEDK